MEGKDIGGAAGAAFMIGARLSGRDGCSFRVWAPDRARVELRLESGEERLLPMSREEGGYWSCKAEGVGPGALYRYLLDGSEARPDPASLSQPRGVHGPSEVVPRDGFPWTDGAWKGVPLERMVIYELHIGAFTPEGTFDAAIPRLADLAGLGVNTIEIMPVAQFPGERNWGYDGAYPFAVQASYGGRRGLMRLVDAAHGMGMAVLLDVVYNHLGPEGNYLGEFGPYFTDRYRTPWGRAVNFDGPQSGHVRAYFTENARGWLEDMHIDGLRLDAVHGIFDFSAEPFLADLSEAAGAVAARRGRKALLIAESDLNDVRVLRGREQGGFGLDSQWSDDFHHSLHALLTGERDGYYSDFSGVADLVSAYNDAFVYAGRYSAFRARRHGNSAAGFPGSAFVVCSQNHDQVGNRMMGDRLSSSAGLEKEKLAAGALLCAPYVPLLFMGQEYGEKAPFLYFVSHSDPALAEAVRAGRRREFEHFSWKGEVPDPQAEATFERSKLRWELRREGAHASLLRFHRELLRLRSRHPSLAVPDRSASRAEAGVAPGTLVLERTSPDAGLIVIMNFSSEAAPAPAVSAGTWRRLLDSADTRWAGPGSTLPDILSPDAVMRPWSVAVYEREHR